MVEDPTSRRAEAEAEDGHRAGRRRRGGARCWSSLRRGWQSTTSSIRVVPETTVPTPFASHRGPAPHVLALVLAGGEGRRLWPLTADRAKPAVPMCGRYRLIDFVLSNLVNSGLLQIKVLTQYKSDSLNTHIARGWRLPAFLDLYVEVVPAQQRTGAVVVQGLGRRDLPVAQRHHRRGARLRRGLRRRSHVQDGRAPDDRRAHRDRRRRDGRGHPRARRRGARVRHPRDRRPRQGRRLRREADAPAEMPGRPGWALASMGNYVFTHEAAARGAGARRLGRLGARLRAQHPARDGGARPRRLRLRLLAERDPGLAPERARLLARRRDHQRLLEGEHGSGQGRARLRSLQSALAAAHLDAAVAAGEVRVRRSRRRLGPRAHGHRHRLAGVARAASSRAGASIARSCRRRCASTASPTSRSRSCSTASTSGGTAASAAPSSTRACTCRRTPRSATTPRPTRAASPSPTASWWCRRATSSCERGTESVAAPTSSFSCTCTSRSTSIPRTRAGDAAVGAAARRARLPRRGARCCDEYGDVKLTVNFVPSLVRAARGGGRRRRRRVAADRRIGRVERRRARVRRRALLLAQLGSLGAHAAALRASCWRSASGKAAASPTATCAI